MTAVEQPFFFSRGGRRIFGILHHAAVPADPPTAVVVCAPLFEEKLHAHRVLVQFARRAAAEGRHVLRFDYYGDGDSEGAFEDATLSSRLADIETAVDEARLVFGVRRVVLVGLRLGATLASAALPVLGRDTTAVLWAPVLDAGEYVYDLLRANLSTQLVTHKKILFSRGELVQQLEAGRSVNVDGYEVSGELFREAQALRLDPATWPEPGKVLVVHVAPDAQPPAEFDMLERAGARCVGVDEMKFWAAQKKVYPPCESLYRATLDWIRRTASSTMQPECT